MLCDECHRKLNERGICINPKCSKLGKDPSREMPSSFRGGNVDPFELADKLKSKKAKHNESQPKEQPLVPELLKCPNPKCGQVSLFWSESLLLFECLNPKCRIKVSKTELEDTYSLRAQRQQEFQYTNPLLLTVKMFLADVRSWRREYVEREYVCADFAREVYAAATGREIRCGYVTIYFEDSYIAHAIVCFETDYGLQFFEPQSGEEEIVKIGKPYIVVMDGVPSDTIVRKIDIKWNDGTSTVIDHHQQ